jgi:uncharacterized protein (TIGR02118 family)
MVRFLVVYDKPKDPEGFERHYREVHIPLTNKLPGLRRYTINRNPAPIRGGEPYYLIAELDWDDMPALQEAFRSLRVARLRRTSQCSRPTAGPHHGLRARGGPPMRATQPPSREDGSGLLK